LDFIYPKDKGFFKNKLFFTVAKPGSAEPQAAAAAVGMVVEEVAFVGALESEFLRRLAGMGFRVEVAVGRQIVHGIQQHVIALDETVVVLESTVAADARGPPFPCPLWSRVLQNV